MVHSIPVCGSWEISAWTVFFASSELEESSNDVISSHWQAMLSFPVFYDFDLEKDMNTHVNTHRECKMSMSNMHYESRNTLILHKNSCADS